MGNCLKRNRGDENSLLWEDTHLNQVASGLEHYSPLEEESAAPIFNLTASNSSSLSSTMSEEQQIKLAQRLGLIQHLPSGTYDGSKKKQECVICMLDFAIGEQIRFLPCCHIYHEECIDDWLLRSFTCPSCMEPVDAALISTFYTTE